MKVSKKQLLLAELKEIFLHVADACDGGEKVPAHLKVAYNAAMEKAVVREFYQDALDEVYDELGWS